MRARNGGAFGLPRAFWGHIAAVCLVVLTAILAASVNDLGFATTATKMPYAEGRPLMAAIASAQLPAEFRNASDADREARWPAWLDRQDRAIRERLRQGDEDTAVLWMALGTSFTREPRVTDVLTASPNDGGALVKVVQARTRDFIARLASAGTDERALFAKGLLAARGLALDTDAARTKAEQFVIQRFAVLMKEQRDLAAQLRAAKQGDASAEFVSRSTLFQHRGLSLDTSFPPSLALQEALAAILARGLIDRGSVRRVAVIGPGLDFADKDAGLDFYAPQTVQPFVLYETLIRLGLAKRDDLLVTTFDVSPRVNQHLAAARQQAARGQPYELVLPIDSRGWTASAREFWKQIGDTVGTAGGPVTVPPGVSIEARAVRVAADVVQRVTPVDLNIVVERAGADEYDVIIATNVLVYYSLFEQATAMANIAAMLRPGGWFLSNTALPEIPGARLRSAGYSTTVYSDRDGDGDHIVWYRRQ